MDGCLHSEEQGPDGLPGDSETKETECGDPVNDPVKARLGVVRAPSGCRPGEDKAVPYEAFAQAQVGRAVALAGAVLTFGDDPCFFGIAHTIAGEHLVVGVHFRVHQFNGTHLVDVVDAWSLFNLVVQQVAVHLRGHACHVGDISHPRVALAKEVGFHAGFVVAVVEAAGLETLSS